MSFPQTLNELEVVKNEWHIPGAIGALECTHIKILQPHDHGSEYLNRKGFCSINVQATCNYASIFTPVDAS